MSAVKKAIEIVEEYLIGIGMIGASVLLFINVAMRYVFGKGFHWSEETIRYAIIMITFVGCATCVRSGLHLSVDVLIQMVKSGKRHLINQILNIINLLFTAYATWLGIDLVMFVKSSNQTSPMIGYPMYLFYLVIPIGMGLSTIWYLTKIINPDKTETI